MFRFGFIIMLQYILLLQIKLCCCENNDKNTTRDCNCICNVLIEAVHGELDEDDRKGDNKIFIKASDKNTQLPEDNPLTNWTSCMEAAAYSLESGIYHIRLNKLNITDMEVFCQEGVDLGGWLVIQRRQSASVDFNKNWQYYKEGFGDPEGNYWIGLEKLYALTTSCEQELYIQMKKNNDSKEYYAKYAEFLIGPESDGYVLRNVGNYSGNAGDSLTNHLGFSFSTYDRDNDDNYLFNCAKSFKGGWWFNNCYYSHLNGVYGDNNTGINWYDIDEQESLAFVQMMIRPNQYCWRRLMLLSNDLIDTKYALD